MRDSPASEASARLYYRTTQAKRQGSGAPFINTTSVEQGSLSPPAPSLPHRISVQPHPAGSSRRGSDLPHSQASQACTSRSLASLHQSDKADTSRRNMFINDFSCSTKNRQYVCAPRLRSVRHASPPSGRHPRWRLMHIHLFLLHNKLL